MGWIMIQLLDKKMEKRTEDLPNGELSPELQGFLENEAREAEIQAAIDAAAEEGIDISREEAAKVLLNEKKDTDSSSPQ